ncbi:hypothetical protein [Ornithinibacillus californiensis]|uniref:hypothetical protein n=1 Tax=Ornithinibacillus californiensis TaxID=161536 RepID=UPI00064D9947|nr:hypothetical protein [Ornithinibacillus californiensis]
MGKENAILSFFKEQKVDYIYSSKEQVIIIPCFECLNEVKMCSNTTNWKCSHCNNNGNLLSLIRFLSNGHILKAKVYNPKREKKKINNMMQNLIKQSPEMTDRLSNIECKINELLQYYEKKTS